MQLCKSRSITFTDSKISNVVLDSESGDIESVYLESGDQHFSDFWVDATGLRRVLIGKLKDNNWKTFSNYLQMDSAIAFPTDPDPSGEIRPYTRARAIKNGWVWEIPTQSRRGNGYVYSSRHCSDDQAIKEVSDLLGFDVIPAKKIKFEPGHLKEMWINNCVAVGLASAFVEPIEATSIGGTIQQARCLIENLSSYKKGNLKVQKQFNKKMNIMMDNVLSMIYLHYISDRRDSQMWIDQSMIPVPEYLQELIELWQERPPFASDIANNNYEMFHVAHFYHVAQGQKIFVPDNSSRMIDNFNLREVVKNSIFAAKLAQSDHPKVSHAESLRQIQI